MIRGDYLEIKRFYKTQRELAIAINHLVDSYWDNEIDEDYLFNMLKILYSNNPGKIMKMGDFTTILKQQCGKRRLEIVEKILSLH